MVGAVVRPTRLAPFERALERGTSSQEGPVQVEGMRQVGVAGDVRPHLYFQCARPDVVELPKARAETLSGADDACALGHEVPDPTL